MFGSMSGYGMQNKQGRQTKIYISCSRHGASLHPFLKRPKAAKCLLCQLTLDGNWHDS
jgi:hypothetical protein